MFPAITGGAAASVESLTITVVAVTGSTGTASSTDRRLPAKLGVLRRSFSSTTAVVPLFLLVPLTLGDVPRLVITAGDLLRALLPTSLNGLLLLNSSWCWGGELGTDSDGSELPELLEEMLWKGLVEVLLGVVTAITEVGEDGPEDMLRKGLRLTSFSTVRAASRMLAEGTLIFSTMPPFCSEKCVTVTLSGGDDPLFSRKVL